MGTGIGIDRLFLKIDHSPRDGGRRFLKNGLVTARSLFLAKKSATDSGLMINFQT
jgi:hypothetical protein